MPRIFQTTQQLLDVTLRRLCRCACPRPAPISQVELRPSAETVTVICCMQNTSHNCVNDMQTCSQMYTSASRVWGKHELSHLGEWLGISHLVAEVLVRASSNHLQQFGETAELLTGKQRCADQCTMSTPFIDYSSEYSFFFHLDCVDQNH